MTTSPAFLENRLNSGFELCLPTRGVNIFVCQIHVFSGRTSVLVDLKRVFKRKTYILGLDSQKERPPNELLEFPLGDWCNGRNCEIQPHGRTVRSRKQAPGEACLLLPSKMALELFGTCCCCSFYLQIPRDSEFDKEFHKGIRQTQLKKFSKFRSFKFHSPFHSNFHSPKKSTTRHSLGR